MAFLAIISMVAGCKTQEIESTWTAAPISIEGKMLDWQSKPAAYFEDEGVGLAVCNDQENLYIQLRTRDQKKATALSKTGLTLYLDAEGKKGTDSYLRLIAGPSSKAQLFCADNEAFSERSISTDGSFGPKAAYDTSSGFYSYEISVTLRASSIDSYGIGVNPGAQIGIGMEWMEPGQSRSSFGASTAKGGGRGGGGRGGGGKGGGGGRGSGSGGTRSAPAEPEKQEIWFKTTIAQAPGTQVTTND
jgi:hypothetical protein